MPQPRKRFKANGEPKTCLVKINAKMAVYLYREARLKGYADETALVNEIVRQWTEKLPPVDWAALRAELEADGEEGEEESPKADEQSE